MSSTDLRIKVATQEEVEIAVDWAAKEGWNPGLHDANCFYQADPEGFLIGYLDDQPAAVISAVRYPSSFAFLGFYIVAEPFRAKGYGMQIWQAALKHLDGYNIGLDGVVEQQHNYKKSGFQLAYRNIRYAGKITHMATATGVTTDTTTAQVDGDGDIVALNSLPLESLSRFDQSFFPSAREQFLSAWIRQPQAHALAILRHDEIAAYGVIRECREGYKIGPLFATQAELADRLFQALINSVEGDKTVYLDIPEANPQAVQLVNRYAMEKVFETARMYSHKAPPIDLSGIYGVTTFELG